MQFGIHVPNFGGFCDPRLMADLARDAEVAGWDGFFIWDHVFWTHPEPQPVGSPWIILAAMAMTTGQIKLGPLVTPLPRRRPWSVAREAITLDHLSGGRLILGAGIGGDWFGDYSSVGEPANERTHGAMLDEALAIIDGLWSGQPFSYIGDHYEIKDALFTPPPVQQPRIPIWLAGMWPNQKPLRRAVRWNGMFPLGRDGDLTPGDIAAINAAIASHRTSSAPFDLIAQGTTSGDDPAADAAIVAPFAAAGATWWLESINTNYGGIDQISTRIRRGPPRL